MVLTSAIRSAPAPESWFFAHSHVRANEHESFGTFVVDYRPNGPLISGDHRVLCLVRATARPRILTIEKWRLKHVNRLEKWAFVHLRNPIVQCDQIMYVQFPFFWTSVLERGRGNAINFFRINCPLYKILLLFDPSYENKFLDVIHRHALRARGSWEPVRLVIVFILRRRPAEFIFYNATHGYTQTYCQILTALANPMQIIQVTADVVPEPCSSSVKNHAVLLTVVIVWLVLAPCRALHNLT